MARTRIQPHLVASPESVVWGAWNRESPSGREPLGPLIEGWDYDQVLDIATSPSVDLSELMRSTGIRDVGHIHVVATVDCPATARRFMSHLPVTDFCSTGGGFITVRVPKGQVAVEIKMSSHLVLMENIPSVGNSAGLKGARLLESSVTRLLLEGDAGRFPTEAVSFAAMRWERAAWSVRVDVEDLNEAFGGAVRLFLNLDHPVGAALAKNDPAIFGAIGSALRLDVVRSVVNAAAERVGRRAPALLVFEEDSFGAVADQMAHDHFGMALPGVAEMRAHDACRFERLLQASVGMEVDLL